MELRIKLPTESRPHHPLVLGCPNYPNTMIHIENTIDISGIIVHLTDKDRLAWIKELVESLQEEGSIGKVRQLVNQPSYDDN